MNTRTQLIKAGVVAKNQGMPAGSAGEPTQTKRAKKKPQSMDTAATHTVSDPTCKEHTEKMCKAMRGE